MKISKHMTDAIDVVRQGGVIAYPTEAVFGLGCDPSNLTAVQRILGIKQRPAHKGLILIASDFSQVEKYLLPLDRDMEKRVFPTWPGAVTWLLPARPDVSPSIRGNHDTLAVRVTANPVVRGLCQKLGHALISTSANIAGKSEARCGDAVQASLGLQPDLILDLPTGGAQRPSEIRDGATGKSLRA